MTGRNQPCPCGSGQKRKKCACLRVSAKAPEQPEPELRGDTVFFHGGAAGLNVGDRLLPRADLPESVAHQYAAAHERPNTPEVDPYCHSRVFFTTNILAAAIYAIGPGDRCVYRVEPEGPVWPDPWPGAHEQYCAASARVAGVRCTLSVEAMKALLCASWILLGRPKGLLFRGERLLANETDESKLKYARAWPQYEWIFDRLKFSGDVNRYV